MSSRFPFATLWIAALRFAALTAGIAFLSPSSFAGDLRVGAARVNLRSDEKMVLAGYIQARYTTEQEGELSAVAVVVEKPGGAKIALVSCDVLWVPRSLADPAARRIEQSTGIPFDHILIHATHTHHSPSTAPAHDFGVSAEFRRELEDGIVRAVEEANAGLANGDSDLHFSLGEERTVGANSRILLPDGCVTWINPARESSGGGEPTGPFDPDLPVLDFRDARGGTRALVYGHSTHTIGTRCGRDVRSASFYGLAAQELETELGGVVAFLQGASGSTHNVTGVPVTQAIERMKAAVHTARTRAERVPAPRILAARRAFRFRVRAFDDAVEDAKIAKYGAKYLGGNAEYIRGVFSAMRKTLGPLQGEERETWIQVLVIGDVAIVGVPAEFFTVLGVEIKRRSPFARTAIAELSNDWIGYLPDRRGHELGGYQTWMGLHSYAEPGTGERVVEESLSMLHELARREIAPPLAPELSRRAFRLADSSLGIDLVAAEPDVESPVAITFDARERLFVAELRGYPETPGLGRVKRLEDADGDGRYEGVRIFADGLDFPAGILAARGGILVADAPEILFLEDVDDDGRADTRRTIWTGFGTGSQQLRANALTWGLDNWIHGANGRSDGSVRGPGADASTAVSLRASDFRFSHDFTVFGAVPGPSQFGRARDDFGSEFLSWNTIPLRHALLAKEAIDTAPALASKALIDTTPADDTRRVFPIAPGAPRYNSESSNHYNAFSGLVILRGSALGESYRGDAFVGESLANLVTRRRLVRDGATFVATRVETDHEFLASRDPWFHPVHVSQGPDGALWIVDFYREYVEHPIYVSDTAARARVDWRRGAEHGRIWRVRRTPHEGAEAGSRAATRVDLDVESATDLVRRLADEIPWRRDTAQRLLVESSAREAVPALRRLVREGESAAIRVQALATLDGLGAAASDDTAVLLGDESAEVRAFAVSRAAAASLDPDSMDALISLSGDSSPRVRFELALAARRCGERGVDLLATWIAAGAPERGVDLAILAGAADRIDRVLLAALAKRPIGALAEPDARAIEFLADAGAHTAASLDEARLTAFSRALLEDRGVEADDADGKDGARLIAARNAILSGIARAVSVQTSDVWRRVIGETTDPDRALVVEKYAGSLSREGDRRRGAAVVRELCLPCHSIEGQGAGIGPDLSSVAKRSPAELLADILDPSRRVEPGQIAYTVVTQRGEVASGLIAAQTTTTVTLRAERGVERTFRFAELSDLRPSGKSLMLDGLESKIDEAAMADLLAFLARPEKALLGD
jgi:putative membrane-bound dehydrogenase-like protein